MLLREERYVDNEYYVYNRLLFRILGLWDYRTSFKQLFYVCFLNILIVVGSLNQIYYLIMSERKLNSIAKLLETTLPTLCFGSCYYNLLSNGGIMKKIFYRINRDWDVLANKPELTILKKYADVSSFCTVTIAINFYLYVGFLIFPSLISNFQYIFGLINENELVIPVVIDYAKKNHMLYYIVLSFQYVVIVILCTVGVANYSMFIAVIQHACALFNIVEWRVNERFKKNLHNFDNINSSIELAEENKWIVDIIEYYTKAIEFVSLFGKIFQVISFEVTKTEGLTNICYVIACLLVIYAYFYFGQKLINHNDNVFITL
ncbi:hypothetical protein HZH66_015450 [Vespula vulgaris]|uniref:Odorant receptor n=1 Tax=Vespula vulgaris TaxID=7454 RepID=A0A834MQ02_VESVU|nr:hypothetical protein HZH66_015450 [Vespula vulgaris]